MSTYPMATCKPPASTRRATAMPVVGRDAHEVLGLPARDRPFVSFRYSYTKLSSQAGKTRLRSRKARLEQGNLSIESLDGELPTGALNQGLGEMQRQVFEHAVTMMRSMSWFVPALRWPRCARH